LSWIGRRGGCGTPSAIGGDCGVSNTGVSGRNGRGFGAGAFTAGGA